MTEPRELVNLEFMAYGDDFDEIKHNATRAVEMLAGERTVLSVGYHYGNVEICETYADELTYGEMARGVKKPASKLGFSCKVHATVELEVLSHFAELP